MKDFYEGVRARLLSDTAVGAAVGERVFWNERPQKSAFPAIVLQIISDAIPAHLGGYEETRSTLVQVDVYAPLLTTALDVSQSVVNALRLPAFAGGKSFGPAFVDGRRDSAEATDTTTLQRVSTDLNIWHSGVN